ncbi:MAG TPA: MBL fold metallo-hydrolase [Gemmatimonadales bacterium]|jgi:glyoxylase-like metal-dependent hydrolase (beta-lactamase superfamily II)|nr:MBL fold metallo-hydrolase [Gemmatimonadales bacterium]
MTAGPESFQLIDLEHLGQRESVAAYLLETRDGPVVVDPGPASTLPRLRAALAAQGREIADLAALLLTHIHLDHAGASGTLARENPRLRVYVHSAGAPHLVDPSKLLASATRLYGARMEELWGEVAPVPAGRVSALAGGERITPGGRLVEVAYTPGHAWHHVSYFEPISGTAFVGDTAGLRTPGMPCVLPVTPPPEFDLTAWLASLDRILAWKPARLALTHFGPSDAPEAHLGELRKGLVEWAGYAKDTLALEAPDEERVRAFVASLERWIDGRVPGERARRFLGSAGPEACWNGLARYWRKTQEHNDAKTR